jgi:hypothetical protein
MTTVYLDSALRADYRADLFDALRERGFDPQEGDVASDRHAAREAQLVLRILADNRDVALFVLGIAVEWARNHLKSRRERREAKTRVSVLFGPRGRVERRVLLEPDDDP